MFFAADALCFLWLCLCYFVLLAAALILFLMALILTLLLVLLALAVTFALDGRYPAGHAEQAGCVGERFGPHGLHPRKVSPTPKPFTK